MKNTFVKIGSLVVLMLAAMIPAQAQIAKTYRTHIPFDFSIGSKTFAAGDYIIEQANPGVSNGGIVFKNKATKASKFFQVIKLSSDQLSGISKLVFDRYGDRYVLAEMITPTLSAKFFQLNRKKSLAAKNKPVREIVRLN